MIEAPQRTEPANPFSTYIYVGVLRPGSQALDFTMSPESALGAMIRRP